MSSHDRFRSSTPPSSEDLSDSERLRESLLAARRYGATLNGLLTAVDVFSRGVDGARIANDALQRRIEHIKDELDRRELRTRELEQEVEELKARLVAQEAAFVAERQFLTDEQDEFLRALLEEHEAQLHTIQRESEPPRSQKDLADANAPSPAGGGDGESLQELKDKIDALRAERERARELVQRMRAQRDGAQAELKRLSRVPPETLEAATIAPAGGAHPTTPAPPPFASSLTPAAATDEHEAAILQNLGVVRLPRLSPPPAELAGALHVPTRLAPAAPRSGQSTPAFRSPAVLSKSSSSTIKKSAPSRVSPSMETDEEGESAPKPQQSPPTRPGIGATYRATPPPHTLEPTEKD